MDQFLIGRKALIRDSGSMLQYTIAGFAWDDGDGVYLARDGKIRPLCVPLSRLELIVEKPSMRPPRDHTKVDGFACTPDEAVEWFSFVMLQASRLFEAVPGPRMEQDEDGAPVTGIAEDVSRDELIRILTQRGEADNGPCVTAALAYYDAATAWYAEDAEKD